MLVQVPESNIPTIQAKMHSSYFVFIQYVLAFLIATCARRIIRQRCEPCWRVATCKKSPPYCLLSEHRPFTQHGARVIMQLCLLGVCTVDDKVNHNRALTIFTAARHLR